LIITAVVQQQKNCVEDKAITTTNLNDTVNQLNLREIKVIICSTLEEHAFLLDAHKNCIESPHDKPTVFSFLLFLSLKYDSICI
jgi:hypothetical protein